MLFYFQAPDGIMCFKRVDSGVIPEEVLNMADQDKIDKFVNDTLEDILEDAHHEEKEEILQWSIDNIKPEQQTEEKEAVEDIWDKDIFSRFPEDNEKK